MALGRVFSLRRHFFDYLVEPRRGTTVVQKVLFELGAGTSRSFPMTAWSAVPADATMQRTTAFRPHVPRATRSSGFSRNCACCRDQSVRVAHALPIMSGSHAFGKSSAIDFGTSNSAAAILENGNPRRIPIQPGSDTLPTAVFFPTEGGAMRIGDGAGAALIAREPGRYMRALKSVLGGPLLREPRMIGGTRRTLADVIAAFLCALRESGRGGDGGPVPPGALRSAGAFPHRRTGARRASGGGSQGLLSRGGVRGGGVPRRARGGGARVSGLVTRGRAGLVVDIGGGTSDFTAFVVEPGARCAVPREPRHPARRQRTSTAGDLAGPR